MFPQKSLFLYLMFLLFCSVSFSQKFTTTWNAPTGTTITIPTQGGGYSYTVDWGISTGEPVDGTTYTGDATHTFTANGVGGVQTVTIDTGTFRRIYFNNTGDKDLILSIEEWGSNHLWTSMNRAFEGCSNLVNNATDTPILTGLTSLQRMFRDATSIGNSLLGNWSWDASNVENMASMFRGATSFNKDIDGWLPSPSSLTNINNMFRDATSFNQDLNSWDTSLVANMSSMFYGANDFNGDIDSWDVEEVTTMSTMFRNATSFNQNLNSWTTTKLEITSNMFYGATDFNGNISGWDVDLVTTMSSMFRETDSFNQSLNSWTPTMVTNMSSMFRDATSFNGNISSWNVGSVLNMSSMFYGATDFNQSLNSWTPTLVTSMANMFRGASVFNGDITSWFSTPLAVTSMAAMFRNADSFNQDISNWDVSTNLNFGSMFRNIGAVFDQDIGGWDVSAGTNFTNMFNGSELSPKNYNALLIGWSAQTLQPSENFHAGTSRYCSTAAIAAKANMEDAGGDNWNITDGGVLTSFTWSGSTDTDWGDTTNWQDGYAPSCNLDVTIPTVTNYPIIDSGTEITVANLTIDSGATLTVNGSLTVDGDLTTNNGLTLESGSSLIVTGTSMGDLSYKRSLANAGQWYYVSPPVSGETIEDYIGNNSLQSGNGNTGLFYYDNNTVTGYAGTGYEFYTPASTGSFTDGKGYGTQVSAASDIIFTGTMNVTDQIIGLVTGGSIDDSNLIGNPFPSYLPANNNAVMTDNLLTNNTSVLTEQTLYFWDNTASDYVVINQISPAYYVSPAQGFFVEASASSDFNFLESWQEHQTTDDFYRNSNTVFNIKLNITDNKNQKKYTHIYYSNAKTVNFDNGYDSSKFVDENASLDIYTRLVGDHNSKDLAIQTLPTADIHTYVIPIGVKSNDQITFNADILNKPNDIKIFLEDRQTNTFTQLENEDFHTINTNEVISGIGRFYLHLQSNTLNIEESEINNVSIYNSDYKEITISGIPFGRTEILVYDFLGKEVFKENFNIKNETSKKLSIAHLKKGFYIVNLKTEKGSISKKIILK